jgi:hypothetical protein
MRKKWTHETILDKASKCATKSEFFKRHPSAYVVAIKLGILEQVTNHMPKVAPRVKKWNLEKLQQEANKYQTKSEFVEKNPAAYLAASRMKILDVVCSHMKPLKHLLWTKEEITKEALKYESRSDFQNNNRGAYNRAREKDWLDDVCSHMPKRLDMSGINSPVFKWTPEKILTEALKFTNKGTFAKKSNGAYSAAKRMGILEYVTSHMIKPKAHNFKWTDEKLSVEALRYSTRLDFANGNSGAYQTAKHRELMDQICSHMKKPGNASKPELELFNELKNNVPELKKLRDRRVKIKGRPYVKGLDIDMFDPKTNRGIEFNGTYWHSFKGLKRTRKHWPDEAIYNYHKIKNDWFISSRGIEILHIREEDWIADKQACIDRCLEFLTS